MAKIKQAQIDEKYIWMGGGLIAIIVVIFVWGRLSGKQDNTDPSDANPNIKPITVSTDSGNIDWNPSATVKKVHTAFVINWMSGRSDVLKELSLLQDIQIKAVAEGYKEVYGTTLRKVLNDAWIVVNNAAYSEVIKRLDILQIP